MILAFSAFTLSVKLENNDYQQLLHLQDVDVVITEGKWYQTFEPYCIFEGGSGALFFTFTGDEAGPV